MFAIKISKDGLDESILSIDGVQKSLSQSRRDALFVSIRYVRGKIFDWITSFGSGTWHDFHPLTRLFQKKSGGQWARRSRILSRSNLNWLTKAVSAWQLQSGFAGGLKFGDGQSVLEKKAQWIESGHKTTVTSQMRSLFGATRSQANRFFRSPQPGRTFFPLRKSTTELDIKSRAVMAPVFARHSQKIGFVFEKALIRGLDV